MTDWYVPFNLQIYAVLNILIVPLDLQIIARELRPLEGP